jgi:hypothetical protein
VCLNLGYDAAVYATYDELVHSSGSGGTCFQGMVEFKGKYCGMYFENLGLLLCKVGGSIIVCPSAYGGRSFCSFECLDVAS